MKAGDFVTYADHVSVKWCRGVGRLQFQHVESLHNTAHGSTWNVKWGNRDITYEFEVNLKTADAVSTIGSADGEF